MKYHGAARARRQKPVYASVLMLEATTLKFHYDFWRGVAWGTLEVICIL